MRKSTGAATRRHYGEVRDKFLSHILPQDKRYIFESMSGGAIIIDGIETVGQDIC